MALRIDTIQVAGPVERDEDDMRGGKGENRMLGLRWLSSEVGHCEWVESMNDRLIENLNIALYVSPLGLMGVEVVELGIRNAGRAGDVPRADAESPVVFGNQLFEVFFYCFLYCLDLSFTFGHG